MADLYQLVTGVIRREPGAVAELAAGFTPDQAVPLVNLLTLQLDSVLQAHLLRRELGLGTKRLPYPVVQKQQSQWAKRSELPVVKLKPYSLTVALGSPWSPTQVATFSQALWRFRRRLYRGEGSPSELPLVLLALQRDDHDQN